jgi:hypothetical protein
MSDAQQPKYRVCEHRNVAAAFERFYAPPTPQALFAPASKSRGRSILALKAQGLALRSRGQSLLAQTADLAAAVLGKKLRRVAGTAVAQ